MPTRAAEIAHHVEEAARIFEALRRQAAEAQGDRRGDRKHLREAAQELRHQQLAAAPLAGDVAEGPHRPAEEREPEQHQPARIEPLREPDVDGHPGERGGPRRTDRDPGLPGAEAADIAEEQRGQVDRREDADAGHKREKAADREIAVLQRPQIDDRAREGQAPDQKQYAGDGCDPGAAAGSSHRRTSSSAHPLRARIRACRDRSPSARCRDSRRPSAATNPARRS